MKVISGYSTDNSVNFSTKRVKVIVYDDFKIEYIPYVLDEEELNKVKLEEEKIEKRKEKLKKLEAGNIIKYWLYKLYYDFKVRYPREAFCLKHEIKKTEIIFLILEIILLVYGFLLKTKLYAIVLAILFAGFSTFNLIHTVCIFIKREKLRKIHGAEHMTYNAGLRGRISKESILRMSRYCNHCGSVKPANLLFVELFNLVLSIMFGVWIPHVLLTFLMLNIYSALPLNFIAHIYQRFLTKKPDDKDLFMAHLCYEILRKTDKAMDYTKVTPMVFSRIIIRTSKDILLDNDYNIKNPFV